MGKKTIRLTESDIKKHIKKVVSEQDITASDIFNPISLGSKIGSKINNYMNPKQPTKNVNHTNSFGEPDIEGQINQFTLVLIKQMNYHFVQETSMHGDKVVLAKQLKYGNMMIFVTDGGDISWYYTPKLYKGQTNSSDFGQRGKLGSVKNWNKAMITNLENGVESHAKVQGNPNQTGTQNLSENMKNKKVVRLTESELKKYISKVVAEQATKPVASTTPAPTKPATDPKIEAALKQSLLNKNIPLFIGDKKDYFTQITVLGFTLRPAKGEYKQNEFDSVTVMVRDNSYYDQNGNFDEKARLAYKLGGEDGQIVSRKGPLKFLNYTCGENVLFTIEQGSNQGLRLVNQGLIKLLEQSMGCKYLNRSVDKDLSAMNMKGSQRPTDSGFEA